MGDAERDDVVDSDLFDGRREVDDDLDRDTSCTEMAGTIVLGVVDRKEVGLDVEGRNGSGGGVQDADVFDVVESCRGGSGGGTPPALRLPLCVTAMLGEEG